jgi:lipopolysaccharide/colanic/teichoic acid biosynthesis glycosyltransferase
MKFIREFIYFYIFKRTADILFSLLLLIVMSPIALIVSAAVYLMMGRPLLQSQLVSGQLRREFRLYTFRTANTDGSKHQFGTSLKNSGLHELPMFFHILKGDMSFIGPRPLPLEDAVFIPDDHPRFNVKPGLTGWAQVNGGSALSWDEMLTHDEHYVKSISFRIDVSTLVMTLAKGVKQETASLDDSLKDEGLGEYLLRTGQIDQQTYEQTMQTLRKAGGLS